MIGITKNTSQYVILTLKEKTNDNITDPAYIFEFTNDMSGHSVVFTAADISTFKDRYNKFVIEETTTEDLYAGQITLSPTGFWKYTIYATSISSPQDLSIVGLDVVETGRVLVQDTTEYPRTVYVADDDKNTYIYE